jgi:16S rRNA (cytidine1402-2'-O)-methyltransferase
VCCLPGPVAFVPALAASGLPSDTFHFEGFLPHKKGRHTALQRIAKLEHTIILYESPHRLVKCLEELIAHCGSDRMACVARELTKLYEEINTASLGELCQYYTAHPPKGEIVILLQGAELQKKKNKKYLKDEEEE